MGWLDNYGKEENYNDSHTSAPEGFEGDGFSNVGRNYSPAWGGQFQMGGNVYPVNYVPQEQFQMGGSLPGSVGFTYAREGAPSNGPYAKKTMASAQNGTEMRYYQNGLDWKPKGMRDGGWIDSYEKAQNGISKLLQDNKRRVDPLRMPVDKEEQSNEYRKLVDTKKYKDAIKAKKLANDRAIITDRKERIAKSNTNPLNKGLGIFQPSNWTRKNWAESTGAIGDKFRMFPNDPDNFVDEWLNPGVAIGGMASDIGTAPLRAKEENTNMPYVTAIASPLLTGALEGIGTSNNKQFVNNLVNPFNIVPGYKSAEKYIRNKIGKIPTSIAPELRQGLQSAGVSLNDLNPFKFKPKSNRLYSELDDKNTIEEFLGKSNITNAQKKVWNNSPSMKSKYLLEADPSKEVFSNELSTYDIPLDHLQGSNIYKKNWLGNYKRIEPVDYFGFTRNGEDLNPFIEPQKVQYSDFIHPEQAADLAHETRNDYENLFSMSMPESPARSNDLYPDVSNNWMTDAIERNAMKDHFYKKSMMPESWEGFYDKFRGNYDWDIKHFPERKAEFDLNFTDITPEEKSHLFNNIQKQREGGVIKDDRGQWDHPGEITEIGSNNITMEGVPYPVLGISDTGHTQMMYPGNHYKFKGKKVTEYPMAKNGVNQADENSLVKINQLTNFTNYNTKQPGGWLDTL